MTKRKEQGGGGGQEKYKGENTYSFNRHVDASFTTFRKVMNQMS